MFYAVVLGKDFANTCVIGSSGIVHSVFERAVNIEIKSPTNYLLTLICENVDIMPANLVVRIPEGVWTEFIKIDDNVILTTDNIYVDNIPRIGGISTAQRWKRLEDDEIAELVKSYKNDAFLCRCKEVEDYLDITSPRSIAFPNMSISSLNPLGLIGLGNGLTPSGDDFLAGMLNGIHFMEKFLGEKCPYLPRIADMITKNLHHTGQISRHFLSYALEAQWGSNTQNFLIALANGNKEALFKAINKKLDYGASSGSDELRGCLYGIMEYLKSR